MSETYQELYLRVENSIKEPINNVISNRKNKDVLDEVVFLSLSNICQNIGTDGYDFNLSMEHFVEKTSPIIDVPLVSLLEKNITENMDRFDYENLENIDTLFSVFYALSLVYKKTGNIEGLENLLKGRYKVFNSFPLYYEVLSRFYKRKNIYREALDSDEQAIRVLGLRGIKNYGVNISYASTICSMLEKNLDPAIKEREAANVYIDEAIEYNPKYSKYYFLKAQYIFYTNFNNNLSKFEEYCEQAKNFIKIALTTLFEEYKGKSAHGKQIEEKYSNFKNKIDSELQKRRNVENPVYTQEDILRMKKAILAADSQNEVKEKPHIPNLAPDDKYVFICYSSDDFKSVYCDLIEMYSRKIPFKYDRMLTAGKDWQTRVWAYIDNSNCAGVIFYISKNTLTSISFCEEIKKICHNSKKDYFAVNLEGSMKPSEILADTIIRLCNRGERELPFGSDRILTFLGAFDDDKVFVHKSIADGETGTSHIKDLTDQIELSFSLKIN